MSARSHRHDPLARTPADVDPTRTRTLRKTYAQRLRGPLRNLNARIREAVRSEDLFGLGMDTLQPVPPRPPRDRDFRFATDDEKTEAFLEWLRRQERRGILEVIHRDENTFVRSAYGSGIRHADAALNREGVTIPERDLQAIFNQPVHRETLQTLYTRNFAELEGVVGAMNQQIGRELTQGFAEGVSPTVMARRITDRVDKIGMTRATTLARTEVIRAHSQSTLNRYEQLGVDEVTVRAEFTTAGDARVCPQCQALEGEVFTVNEARGVIPIHPSCRCSWIPVTS